MYLRRLGFLTMLAMLTAPCSDPPKLASDRDVAPSSSAPAATTESPKAVRIGALMVRDGIPLPVLEDRGHGAFVVQTLCGHRAVARRGTPVFTADVVIDPGHGGEQAGAVGPGGLAEKVPNLEVSQLLKEALQAKGLTAALTRTGDYRVALATRGAFAQTLKAKVFISVHFNADPDEGRDTPGAEAYFQHRSSESKRLAGLVYEEIYRNLDKHTLSWAADRDAGVKPRVNDGGNDYYAVLRLTAGTPAVLTESAFISNGPEEELLRDERFKTELAGAMANGIERYLRTSDPGSGFIHPYERDSPVSSGSSDASCQDPDLGLFPVAEP